MSAHALDEQMVEQLKELGKFDPSALKRILSAFNKGSEEDRGRLNDSFHERDAQVFVAAAHRLRGSASSLGGQMVGETCGDMEIKVKGGSWTEIDQDLARLDICLDEFRQALAREF